MIIIAYMFLLGVIGLFAKDLLNVIDPCCEIRFYDLNSGIASQYKKVKDFIEDEAWIERKVNSVFFGGTGVRQDYIVCFLIILVE